MRSVATTLHMPLATTLPECGICGGHYAAHVFAESDCIQCGVTTCGKCQRPTAEAATLARWCKCCWDELSDSGAEPGAHGAAAGAASAGDTASAASPCQSWSAAQELTLSQELLADASPSVIDIRTTLVSESTGSGALKVYDGNEDNDKEEKYDNLLPDDSGASLPLPRREDDAWEPLSQGMASDVTYCFFQPRINNHIPGTNSSFQLSNY